MVENSQGTLAMRWKNTKDFIVLSNCHKEVIREEKKGSSRMGPCWRLTVL